MEKRTSPVVCLALAALLCALPVAHAQDLYVTNLDQLVAEAYSTDHSVYLPFQPWDWRAYSLDGGEPWWLDCSQVSCDALFQNPVQLSAGVPAYTVVLIQNVLTGETTIQPDGSSDVVATVPAPSNYQPVTNSWNGWMWNWYQQVVDQPDSWGFSPDEVPPPTITLKALLADVNNYATFQGNLEAQVEAAQAAQAATARMSSRFMPMDDDGGGGGPCTLTNLLQAFTVTNIVRNADGSTKITWQSCQFFRYLVFSASVMRTNMQWVPQAYVWGATNASATSWTDLSTTNNDGNTVTQRFYRVQRILGSPIAAGGHHSLAVTPDGKMWAWGLNGDGQLGDGIFGDTGVEFTRAYPGEVADPTACNGQTVSNVVALAAGGEEFTVTVDASGSVWTCGDNDDGELGWGSRLLDEGTPSPVAGVSNVVSVAAGALHALALRADMTVLTWGYDMDGYGYLSGQLGVGGLSYPHYTISPTQSLVRAPIVAIAAGSYHSVALDVNSMVWTWGEGGAGQLGNGGDTNVMTPIMLTTISNVIAVAAGAQHTLALTADKTVWAWGTNSLGQIGDGSTITRLTPVRVTNLSSVVAIAAGTDFSLALTSDGFVYGWGDNSAGQLATNKDDLSFTNTPIRVDSLSNVVLVSAPVSTCYEEFGCADGKHSMAMTVNGGTNHYWGWGDDYYGEVGNGTNYTNSGGNNYQSTPAQVQFCTRCQRCIQLGTGGGPSGIFTAQCNGTLYLYFNTDNFGGADGSFTASVGGFGQFTVMGNNSTGARVGLVTIGNTYTYTASGQCYWQRTDTNTVTDADGIGPNGPWNCDDFSIINKTNAVCPMWQCFRLVGRIQ
jgi:alpha-tubulin suppressor-like RCC1 family protein